MGRPILEDILSRYSLTLSCLALQYAACIGTPDDTRSTSAAELDSAAAPPGGTCRVDTSLAPSTDYAQPGPHAVGVLDVDFEDPSRPIVANAKHGAANARPLPARIYYPAQDAMPLFGALALATGGPFPLLVHSHGYGSSRAEARHMAERAASHGYVVVAADFPFTKTDRLLMGDSLDTSDIANQAGDVSFLIDQLLALAHNPRHLLWRAVDQSRIGATGVSMGGLTTLLAAYHPELHDERIRAAAPIAPLSSFFMPEFYHTRTIPLLLLSGDQDAFIDYKRNARRSFERAAPNAQLVTLAKGSHAAFAFPLDGLTLALMNTLLGPADADPSNPDGFGCAQTGAALRADSDYLAPLGGKASFVDYDAVREPWLPCSGPEYKQPAMDAEAQVELGAQAVVAFFDAHFGGTAQKRSDGCTHLVNTLPRHAGVRVE
ncbi:MAG: hypothetical protein RL385_769 [Pseudomonadota bacterium]